MKKITFLSYFIFSIFLVYLTFDNHEKIDTKIKKIKKTYSKDVKKTITANYFDVIIEKVFDLKSDERTASLFFDDEKKSKDKNLLIFTQDGKQIKGNKVENLDLTKNFVTIKNGGLKTVFFIKDIPYGLATMQLANCFYAAIINLADNSEIFKTKCFLGTEDILDLNGIGSNYAMMNNKIYLSIGTPEWEINANSQLAQDKNSYIGKILEFEERDFPNKIIPNIFSYGHRNPQGIVNLENELFATEHGPRGGDELNKINNGQNYGWPKVSYGTNYLGFDEGKSLPMNHEQNGFIEPLFAFVPSVAISDLSECPNNLKKFYKKQCLMALSLGGNALREGKSLIIFLLNEKKNTVHSIEKIKLNDSRFRHFAVIKGKKKLYEDEEGNFYISADYDGVYKIKFSNIR